MVQFILGLPGSGKSTVIADNIVSDLKSGKHALLIVPEQEAVEAEQRIADASADVPTVELDVLNFSRLANLVFRKFGGLSYNYINTGARSLIMWQTLNSLSPILKEFKGISLTDRHFISVILNTVSEFKAFNIRPFMLENAAYSLSEYRPALSRKLSDLSLIYASYEELLKNGYDDPADDLTLLSHTLESNRFFNGINIYIDSFTGFTPQEYSVLYQAFKQADNVTIALSHNFGSDSPAFETLRRTEKNLHNLASECHLYIEPDILLTQSHRFNNNELIFLSENLWNYKSDKVYTSTPEYIKLIECGDLFSEAEAVAKDILRKIRSGSRYRDFVVIAGNVAHYYGIIDAVFEKYNIPFFLSVRTDLTIKPLIKLILASLTVISNNWRCGDVISYIKTGLAGLTPDECDILERYVTTWNINGRRWTDDYEWNLNPDGYTDKFTEHGKNTVVVVNELRKRITSHIVKFAEAFGKNCSVKSISAALYDYLTELDVSSELDDVQIWNTLMETLDQLVSAVPELHVNAEQYSQLFYMVIGNVDIGKIPAAIDEVVIGNASHLRVNRKKYAYLLGVNDGSFPGNASEDVIFNDSDRILLDGAGLKLPDGSNDKINDELLCFYNASTCISDTLTIIYSTLDLKGNAIKPSSACEQLQTLFPLLKPEHYADTKPIDLIEGYDAAFEYVRRFDNTALGNALYDFYNSDPAYRTRIESLATPVSQTEHKLTPKTSQLLYDGNLSLTQSRLDSYVKCHFAYYSRYILKLSEQKHAVFRSVDIGNFIHRILERFMAAAATPDGLRTDFSDTEIETLVDSIIDEYICMIKERTSRIDYLFKRLKRTSLLLIRNLLDEFSQSSFIPQFFELPIKFGDPEAVMPLQIPLYDGTNAYIYGYIDRVDTYKKGKDVYVRVVDYKTGIQNFSLSDIRLGLNLQMLLYLFAIWQNPSPEFKLKLKCEGDILPAGVLYFTARSPDISLANEVSSEQVMEQANSELKRNGLLIEDEDILRAMDKRLEGQFIPVKMNKDGAYVANAPLTTIEGFGELMRSISGTVKKIASELKGGEASVKPLKTPKHDACEFCPNKPICRRYN